MKLELGDAYWMSPFEKKDIPEMVEWLNDQMIYQNTLHVPSPYTEMEAITFVDQTEKNTQEEGKPVNFAIRNPEGEIIGGIGFYRGEPKAEHSREIGYWLAAPYRGQGIMTNAVRKIAEYAHQEFGAYRIVATVFEENIASIRVLEKVGFQEEGFLRKRFVKNGQALDVHLYALLIEAQTKS